MRTHSGRRGKGWPQGVLVAGLFTLAVGAIVAGLDTWAAWAQTHTIQSVYPIGFKDLSCTLKRSEMNVSELNKISPDFANAYRVGNPRVLLKDPGMFRMDSKVGFLRFQYIINGTRTLTRAPLVNDGRTIGDDPGKRQGALDLGFVTEGALRGYKVEHQNCSTLEGRPVCCYRLTYAHDTERYELIWVDTERRHLLKRSCWTKMHGEMKMTYIYGNPQKVPFADPATGSMWLPQRIEVRNAEDKKCGVTIQTDIRLNSGVDTAVFKI